MRQRRLALIFVISALTACGKAQEPAQPGGQEPAADEPAAVQESSLIQPLDQPYALNADGVPTDPAPGDLPVEPGEVVAHWFRSGGVYVALFQGLDLEATGPLCPGTSLSTTTDFLHVTNSPTADGACPGVEKIAGPDEGVRVCDSAVFYVTQIPEDAEGNLYASIERYPGDGSTAGVTGSIAAAADAAPEIDLSAPVPLPEELGGEVTCPA